MIRNLIKKIKSKEYKVGIVGMGYVGLPLAWSFHLNKIPVIGFDIDKSKISNLNNGIPYIKHLGKNIIQDIAKS